MKLVLFFSRGISLRIWEQTGLIDRELEIYHKLLNGISKIVFVTYGKCEEKVYSEKIRPIEVLDNYFNLPIDIFSIFAPFRFHRQLKSATLFKTNQINGWWTAGIAKLIYRKPLIVRCGYLLSTNQEQKWKNYSKLRIKLVSFLEKLAFKYADKIIVTTSEMKYEATKRHNILPEKLTVIPNSVNVNVFKPLPEVNKIKGRLGFVGRFTGQKNIHLLIEAASQLENVSLLLVGSGPLKSELEKIAKKHKVKVKFLGNVPNHELPRLLNSCEAFIMSSGWEGMPKALLEAMACGLPVIGADAPGIRDIIKNGQTGILCKHDVRDIRNAIKQIFDDKLLAKKIGNNARRFVLENFSLEKSIEKELELLRSLVQNGCKK